MILNITAKHKSPKNAASLSNTYAKTLSVTAHLPLSRPVQNKTGKMLYILLQTIDLEKMAVILCSGTEYTQYILFLETSTSKEKFIGTGKQAF